MKRRKFIFFIVFPLLLIALVPLGIYLKNVAHYKKAVREISFDGIDISGVADGTYTGECDVDFIYAKVRVTVSDGKITGIDILEHKNGRGKAAEAIIGEIIERQEIDVDAVSGATNSSAVLKKAVENALNGGS